MKVLLKVLFAPVIAIFALMIWLCGLVLSMSAWIFGILGTLFGVEGPEIYKLNGKEEWCLIVDRFATHMGYLPLVTDNLANGEFRILGEEEFDMGAATKRHGGILPITEEEYQTLVRKGMPTK